MNPSNSSINKETCASTSSNCVVWQGPDLPCLSLCTGDSITDVMFKLSTAFCEFKDEFDFSDVDISCIFDACIGCPDPEKTLRNILTLLIAKVCELKDLIDDINVSPTVNFPVLEVNLGCLAVTDGSGNILNDDTNEEIVQSIIDQVCDNKSDIALLDSRVDDHEDRITVLENESDPAIPQVTSDCLFLGSKDIDEAFELLDADYCAEKDAIGDVSDIGSAIAQQCDLPALIGNPDFIVSPTNLAESFSNLWLAYCNLLDRVTSIENTCCKPTCDDIKIGFSTVFNQDSSVTLLFNAGTGTTIPAGWEDCGSILTITDAAGNSISVSLTIVNNYTSPDIDLTSFTSGNDLTFTLDVKMCNADAGITCQKCVSKTVKYLSTGCCEYCNSSTSEEVVIVYTTTLTNNN